MLGSKIRGERHGLGDGIGAEQRTVPLQCAANDFAARDIGQTLLDRVADREPGLVVETNDDHARVHVVLRLRNDFASDRSRVATRTANHQQLTRPRWRVDADIPADL